MHDLSSTPRDRKHANASNVPNSKVQGSGNNLSLSAARSSDPFTRSRRHCGRRYRTAGYGISLPVNADSVSQQLRASVTEWRYNRATCDSDIRQISTLVIHFHYIWGIPTIHFHTSHYTRPKGSAHRLTSCELVLSLGFGCRSVTLPDLYRDLLTFVVA